MTRMYYPFFDGLRAVAVLWVLIVHIRTFIGFPSDSFLTPALDKLSSNPTLGIDMFFVISGFLITGLLIRSYDTDIRIGRFYVRSAFKILPQYAALLAVAWYFETKVEVFGFERTSQVPGFDGAIMASHMSDIANGKLLAHFFFLQNFTDRIMVLAHTWSLCIEEHFYLTYPLMVAVIFRLCKSPGARRKYCAVAILCVILLSSSFRIFHVGYAQFIQ